jgi:sulfide:quinone oxidoreductase
MDITPNVTDSDGFVKADRNTMRIEGFGNAFAVGDASNLPTSKSGVTAHLEAAAVADIINGKDSSFDGRTNCTLRTDSMHALFIISDYQNPVVPTKPSTKTCIMEKMNELSYWMGLKGSMSKFTDMYFKSTIPAKLNKKVRAPAQNEGGPAGGQQQQH